MVHWKMIEALLGTDLLLEDEFRNSNNSMRGSNTAHEEELRGLKNDKIEQHF